MRYKVLLLVLLMGNAAAADAVRDIKVTLKADGEHCVVLDITIPCIDLATHLRDTLKLPRETVVQLRAGRSASYQSVRKVLDIIEKSGFRHPVASVQEPGK
jgi:biopolymer transport protein ExbD